MDARAAVGATGEDAAAAVYRRLGYRVLARNWRCRLGELDLVVVRDGVLVICEVKSRRGPAFGGGYEAVTPRKQAKLRALAEIFLRTAGDGPRDLRFDVASVDLSRPGGAVQLFDDAF
jgi:putative endonuclease